MISQTDAQFPVLILFDVKSENRFNRCCIYFESFKVLGDTFSKILLIIPMNDTTLLEPLIITTLISSVPSPISLCYDSLLMALRCEQTL